MWELIKLSDGKWSIRWSGRERWILADLGWETALEVERMLKFLDPRPEEDLCDACEDRERVQREMFPYLPTV